MEIQTHRGRQSREHHRDTSKDGNRQRREIEFKKERDRCIYTDIERDRQTRLTKKPLEV